MSTVDAPGADLPEGLAALDRALASWAGSPRFDAATMEVVGRFGDAPADVRRQLRHVAARCDAAAMRELARVEDVALGSGPAAGVRSVLVLSSGGVPGLVLEGIAAALALGARAVVRPSRDEAVLEHLLAHAAREEPALLEHVDVLDPDDELDPPGLDAAIVHGSDETVTLVRELLPAGAPVAAYGSREGIAVVLAGAPDGWAPRLADDVLAFRQRGCMSPSWCFLVERDQQAADALVSELGRALASGRERHLAAGVDDRFEQRRRHDAHVLGTIAAAHMDPDVRVLHAGDAELRVVRVDDLDQLAARVATLGSLLQTASVAAPDTRRDHVMELLRAAGCTRTCEPGRAHLPEPGWVQDGIGRLAPLLPGAPG